MKSGKIERDPLGLGVDPATRIMAWKSYIPGTARSCSALDNRWLAGIHTGGGAAQQL